MWEKELQVAKLAAVHAGIAIMDIYENATDMQVEYKSDESPLTIADKASNRIIVELLRINFPDYAILSEEEKDNLSRLDNDFCFVVDPLDGTKEFIKRNGQFTVNIALSYKHQSVMGVIYVPVTGELYYASQGDGAYRRMVDTNADDWENKLTSEFEVEKLHVSDNTDIPNLRVVMSSSHGCAQMDELLEKYHLKNFVKKGSSLKGCMIASGEADIYYRFNPTMEWDTAAMQCIVEEAGGVFRQMDGTPMRYNRENSLNEKGFFILNKMENLLINKNRIYVVGAHSRGKTLAYYLQYLHPEIQVEAYLYDNDEPNEAMVEGVPVIHFDENTQLNVDYPVYIGTRGVFHSSIIEKLVKIGMKDIRPVTVALDLEIRNEYLKKYYESVGREFIKIDDIQKESQLKSTPNACVYVAKSIYDSHLKDVYELQTYEHEIQVGAALTTERLGADVLVDNVGENISDRNKQFCELTALYWIWKHAKEEVVGLVHYRRHFTLPEDWLHRIQENKVDVVLPIPLYVVPSVEGNFRSRHDGSDLDYLYEYLQKRNPLEYEEVKEYFQTGLYCPCNMFIARKEVVDDLCEWLFPILFAVAEHGGQKEDAYLNRYPGFISERLITYFFEKHRDKYNVVYSDKNFLQ